MGKLAGIEIQYLGRLANLHLSSAEKKILGHQLSEVLAFVGKLAKINTRNIEPTSQTTGLSNRLRNDIKKADYTLTTEEALSGTNKVYNNFFVVRSILSKRSHNK